MDHETSLKAFFPWDYFSLSFQVEYSTEMLYTALVLIAVTALGSVIPIILRHLKHMHWAALATSSRMITVAVYLPILFAMGDACLPSCGLERYQIICLCVTAFLQQTLAICSYKFEEAHTITLVDGASNIVSAFLFQALFFLEAPGPLKIVEAGVVLASVFIIGGSKLREHKKKELPIH